MKELNQKLVPLFLISILSFGVAACGSNPSTNGFINSGNPMMGAYGTMGAYGSIPTVGSPMMGVGGYSGNGGYLGGSVMGPTSGCYPLTAPIPFSAQNAFINGDVVKAGVIPPYLDPWPYENPPPGYENPALYNAYGTVMYGGLLSGPMMTAYPTVLSYGGGLMITNRQEADGTLQVNVTTSAMTNPYAAYTGTPAFLSGMIYISPIKAALINATHGSGGMFTGAMPYFNSACVSAVSLSMSYTYTRSGLTFNGGRVFLYLNGTAHGSYLQL